MAHSSVITRRRFVQISGVAIAMPAIIGTARAQTKFTCRIAHNEAIGSPLTQAFENWTKLLNEKSGGRIEAQHFRRASSAATPRTSSRTGSARSRSRPAAPTPRKPLRRRIAATGGAPGFIYRDDAPTLTACCRARSARKSRASRGQRRASNSGLREVGFRHILAKRKVTSLGEVKGLRSACPS